MSKKFYYSILSITVIACCISLLLTPQAYAIEKQKWQTPLRKGGHSYPIPGGYVGGPCSGFIGMLAEWNCADHCTKESQEQADEEGLDMDGLMEIYKACMCKCLNEANDYMCGGEAPLCESKYPVCANLKGYLTGKFGITHGVRLDCFGDSDPIGLYSPHSM